MMPDLGAGVDNILHTEKRKLQARISVINLMNKDARYNFLSTFTARISSRHAPSKCR
jgi:hypothetical protein